MDFAEEVLSQEDIDKFKQYMYTHEVQPIREYLDIAWTPYKDTLYNLLGKNVIVKFPVEIKATETLLTESFKKFQNSHIVKQMHEEFCNMLKNVLFDGNEGPFYLYEKPFQNEEEKEIRYAYHAFQELTSPSRVKTYVKNSLGDIVEWIYLVDNAPKDYISIKIPNTNVKLKLTRFEKPFKFFKRIAKQCFPYLDSKWPESRKQDLLDLIEESRILQSQLLNIKTVKGNLCLSIHPLDYVTMSDNSLGWGTCMSWKNRECYRMGTLEMLASPYVVVAYLESETPFYDEYSEITWNNKKWRELFIVDKDIICGTSSYPYRHEELEEICLLKLKELAETNLNWSFKNDICKTSSANIYPESKDPFYHYGYISLWTNFMYNDLENGKSALYILSTTVEEKLSQNNERIIINYGNGAYCLSCGTYICAETEDEINLYGDGGECHVCRNFEICDDCGAPMHSEDAYSVDGGAGRVCGRCLDENYSYCNHCEDWHSYINFTTVRIPIMRETSNVVRFDDYYVCEDCYNALENIYNGNASNLFCEVEIPLESDETNHELQRENPWYPGIRIDWWHAGETVSNVLKVPFETEEVEEFFGINLSKEKYVIFPDNWKV